MLELFAFLAPAEIAGEEFKTTNNSIQWLFERAPGRAEFYVVSLQPEDRNDFVDFVRVDGLFEILYRNILNEVVRCMPKDVAILQHSFLPRCF